MHIYKTRCALLVNPETREALQCLVVTKTGVALAILEGLTKVFSKFHCSDNWLTFLRALRYRFQDEFFFVVSEEAASRYSEWRGWGPLYRPYDSSDQAA